MTSFNKAKVAASLKKLLDTQDLNVITEKKLRRLIEKDLEYDELILDQDDGKKFIKEEVVRLLAEKEKESESGDSLDSDSVAFSSPKSKVKAAPKKSTSKSKKPKALSEDEADEIEESKLGSLPKSTKRQSAKKVQLSSSKLKQVTASEDQISSKSSDGENNVSLKKESESESLPKKASAKVKGPKAKSTPIKKAVKRELSESDTEEAASKISSQKIASQVKRTKSEAPDDDSIQNSDQNSNISDLSSLEDSNDEKKTATKKKIPSKKRAIKAKSDVQFSDKTLNKIKQLKNYILKCGTRKNWKSVLADLGPRQQINTLSNILGELGMKGRPTIEKCKVIARQQELKRETESLDLSNIITEERRPRRTCSSINYSKFDAPSSVGSEEEVQASEEDSQASSNDVSESEEEWDGNNSSRNEAPTKKRHFQNTIPGSEDEESDSASLKKDSIDDVHLSDSGSRLSVLDNETKDEDNTSLTKSLKCDHLPLMKEESPAANFIPEKIPLVEDAKLTPAAETPEPIASSPKVLSQPSYQKLDVDSSLDAPKSHKTVSPTSQPKSPNLLSIEQITLPVESSHEKSLDALMFSDSD